MNVLNMIWKINNDTAKITKIKIINLEKIFWSANINHFCCKFEKWF